MTPTREQIKESRSELYRILFAIEQFNIYKKSRMKIKDFDEYLAKLKKDKEEEIYSLKNQL